MCGRCFCQASSSSGQNIERALAGSQHTMSKLQACVEYVQHTGNGHNVKVLSELTGRILSVVVIVILGAIIVVLLDGSHCHYEQSFLFLLRLFIIIIITVIIIVFVTSCYHYSTVAITVIAIGLFLLLPLRLLNFFLSLFTLSLRLLGALVRGSNPLRRRRLPQICSVACASCAFSKLRSLYGLCFMRSR